jgi:hypothetical protein
MTVYFSAAASPAQKPYHPYYDDMAMPAKKKRPMFMGKRPDTPKFGFAPMQVTSRIGANFLLGMTRFLKAITGEFLVSFTVMDLGFLGVPRVAVSLIRNATQYKPEDDPNHTKRKPFQQWMYSNYQTIKNWNWRYAAEEVSRELQAGPYLTAVQSIVLIAASSWLVGSRGAMLMPHQDLKSYARFAQHYALTHSEAEVKKLIDSHKATLGQLSGDNLKAFKVALNQAFTDDFLSKTHVQQHGSQTLPTHLFDHYIHQPDKALDHVVEKAQIIPAGDQVLVAYLQDKKLWQPHSTKMPTYQEIYKLWSKEYAAIDAVDVSLRPDMRDKMNTVFERLTYWLNVHTAGKDTSAAGQVDTVMKAFGHADIDGFEVTRFLDNTRKYTGLLNQFADQLVGQAKKAALHENDVLRLLHKVTGQSINNKVMGIIATLAGIATVASVAMRSQNPKIPYPGVHNPNAEKPEEIRNPMPNIFASSNSFEPSTTWNLTPPYNRPYPRPHYYAGGQA